MQGILYLERAPKLAVETPTAIAKTMANTKQVMMIESEKQALKKLPTPLFKKK